jgi:hypothetical protein
VNANNIENGQQIKREGRLIQMLELLGQFMKEELAS